MLKKYLLISVSLLPLSACGQDQKDEDHQKKNGAATLEASLVKYTEDREVCTSQNPLKTAYYGDLHVHTSYSFDAYPDGTRTTPEDAYDYARGKAIAWPPYDENGHPTQMNIIDRPLDFAAVTDHSEFLGETALCLSEGSPSYKSKSCTVYRQGGFKALNTFAQILIRPQPSRIKEVCGEGDSLCRQNSRQVWDKIIAATESAYDRSSDCTFTSFIAYEHTGTPGVSNFHRNVIFRNSDIPLQPITYIEAPSGPHLWNQLEQNCTDNCDVLVIPHNSNLSNGRMLVPSAKNISGVEAQVEMAKLQARSEPLMEIFQHKGASECINGLPGVLGEPDELCAFEQVRKLGSTINLQGREIKTSWCQESEEGRFGIINGGCISRNDFLRGALTTGINQEQELGVNPMKYGVIASSDTHMSAPGSVKEQDWKGHSAYEATLTGRLKEGYIPNAINGNPGGLAGVWAVENSRDALFNSMQAKEVFGTSGPRIAPRFFAGWGLSADLCQDPDMVKKAYDQGVPMGGDLIGKGEKPKFLIAVGRDPARDANQLERIQLVKGWIDSKGQSHTKVMNIAGKSGSSKINPETGERSGIGHDSLCAVAVDDGFNPLDSAWYYARILEVPSLRWSQAQCLSLKTENRPNECINNAPKVIQERAWTSPIWYRHSSGEL